MINGYIEKNGVSAPEDTLPMMRDAFAAPDIRSLIMNEAGITTIVWANGYQFDYSMVRLPVFDEFGYPETDRGVTRYPGLYFAGLPWLNSQRTGLLVGVGDHAAYIAEHISNQPS
jgi:putative flavoprotein involved in K+ transport